MEQITELRAAVEKLLEELSRHESKGKPGAPDDAGQETAADDETGILHELAAYLAETGDDIGEVLARHPAATAGAAFLLGVAVGRLSK